MPAHETVKEIFRIWLAIMLIVAVGLLVICAVVAPAILFGKLFHPVIGMVWAISAGALVAAAWLSKL